LTFPLNIPLLFPERKWSENISEIKAEGILRFSLYFISHLRCEFFDSLARRKVAIKRAAGDGQLIYQELNEKVQE